jgi:hypothetical protein
MLQPVRELSWESISDPMRSQQNPTWHDVETRIQSLAVDKSASVFLRAANGRTMSVGGDQGKGYIVGISHNDAHQNLLAPISRRAGTVSLVIGFQPSDYPCRIVVELNAALKVARAFFNTGRADESEEWSGNDAPHSGHR